MSGRGLLPRAGRYANLARDRRWQEGRVDSEALAWWAGQLHEPPLSPLRELVRPRVQPATEPVSRIRESRRVAFALDAALANGLRRLARDVGATPYMVVLAAFRVLLVRLTGQADICIGTPMTLRDSPDLKDIVGCLVNPVVLRNTVQIDQSFQEHLHTERRTALDAFRFRDVPFSRIVEAVAPLRQLGEHPLFQILFSWESATDPIRAGGIEHELISVPAARQSYFDLECAFQDAGDGAALSGYFAWCGSVMEDWVGE
ncbi:MAG: condensation domain-containing protein [Gammaproteobacteria bacterium]